MPGYPNKSLADNPRVGDWLRFLDNRTVVVATGKAELGQGVLTALTQIAADELSVDLSRISMISADTDLTPDEGYTAGSMSVEVSGDAIRFAARKARALMLSEGAARLGCSPISLSVDDGRLLQNDRDSGLDWWSLAAAIDQQCRVLIEPDASRPLKRTVVGRSAPRLDLPLKISGGGFIHDLVFYGMMHARVLRAPRRGARLGAVDDVKICAQGAARLVRRGDFLAVVAESEHSAARALERARRHSVWEGGVAVPDDAGMPDWLTSQPTEDRTVEIGQPILTNAPSTIIEATYARPYLAHASIGPSCALAICVDGRLTVWTHSQGVFPLRRALATALNFDPGNIRVRHNQGAGCYGHNGADDAAFDAALVAVQCPGETIRVLWSREDEMSSSPFGAAMATRIRAALDEAGRPIEWTTEIWSGPHAQRPGMNGGVNLLGAEALPDPIAPPPVADLPDAAGGGATRNAIALYDLPHQRITHHLIPEQPVRTSSLRTLGAFANTFAIECFIDELADQAKRDPLDYRLSLMTDARARRVIEQAAAMAQWDPGAPAGNGRGKGIGFARYKNRGAYCAIVAEAEIEEEIRLLHVWCAVDAGLIVNPDGARNQIEGGIIQGASWTLKEAVRFADGQTTSTDFEAYPIIRFSEIPSIEIALIDAPHEPSVGIGEASSGPIAAAIGNAASRALGARLRFLPLSRERILAAIL